MSYCNQNTITTNTFVHLSHLIHLNYLNILGCNTHIISLDLFNKLKNIKFLWHWYRLDNKLTDINLLH